MEASAFGGGARSGGTVRETEGKRESGLRESSWALVGMGNLGVDMYDVSSSLSLFF